ncbi:MAG: chromate transporter [Clostridiales bacterium]|jgi:chromate transporter|nr:chromate transporter [Clostridiales bacterium]
MIYLEIFGTFFQIGLCSVGGGYVILPLMQSQIVESKHWLTMREFADLVSLSQMTPGPIAINAATFVGMKMGGPMGAVMATAGSVAPSCVIVLALAHFYQKYKNLGRIQGIFRGLRPGVAALIASAGLSMIVLTFWGGEGFAWPPQNIDILAVPLFAACLFLLRRFKFNPILTMLGAGLAGLAAGFFQAGG